MRQIAKESAVVPLNACPGCGHKIDRAAHISDPAIYAMPSEGDVTVCIQCMAWLIFRGDLSMRLMTKSEREALSKEELDPLVELTYAIKEVHELQARRPKMR